MMKDGKMTTEMFAALLAAERENKFCAESLYSEITPLFDDYFICKVDGSAKALKLSFSNGQRFVITIHEV